MEVTDDDKHASLLRKKVITAVKKFYNTGPLVYNKSLTDETAQEQRQQTEQAPMS